MKKIVLPLILLLSLYSCSGKMAVYTMENDENGVGISSPGENNVILSASASEEDGNLQVTVSRSGTRNALLSFSAADVTMNANGKEIKPEKAQTFIDLDNGDLKSADFDVIKQKLSALPEDTLTAISVSSFISYGNAHDAPEKFSLRLHLSSPSFSKDTILVFTRKIVDKPSTRMY